MITVTLFVGIIYATIGMLIIMLMQEQYPLFVPDRGLLIDRLAIVLVVVVLWFPVLLVGTLFFVCKGPEYRGAALDEIRRNGT